MDHEVPHMWQSQYYLVAQLQMSYLVTQLQKFYLVAQLQMAIRTASLMQLWLNLVIGCRIVLFEIPNLILMVTRAMWGW